MIERPHRDRLRIRPYALTGGRVRSSTELGLETIVRVTSLGEAESGGLPSEQRQICALCFDPMSIAEVSAHLSLPLGVARVLVGDMVTERFLDCDAESVAAQNSRPDLRLLERVLDGLQAL